MLAVRSNSAADLLVRTRATADRWRSLRRGLKNVEQWERRGGRGLGLTGNRTSKKKYKLDEIKRKKKH